MIRQELNMEDQSILKELTNLPQDTIPRKQKPLELEYPKPNIHQHVSLNKNQIDFRQCVPTTIHEQSLTITIKKELPKNQILTLKVLCDDQELNDCPELIFGIRQNNQKDYYDDYKIKVKKANQYQFIIGVKTPIYEQYLVKSRLLVFFDQNQSITVPLKQIALLPHITCPKELQTAESRMIKLSIVRGKSKKQCRVPFKLNDDIRIGVTVEVIGLEQELIPILDVKPKSMTLTGKGQFSVSFFTNMIEEIRKELDNMKTYTVRRILTLKIKETKFIYHFPIELTFHPESKTLPSVD